MRIRRPGSYRKTTGADELTNRAWTSGTWALDPGLSIFELARSMGTSASRTRAMIGIATDISRMALGAYLPGFEGGIPVLLAGHTPECRQVRLRPGLRNARLCAGSIRPDARVSDDHG